MKTFNHFQLKELVMFALTGLVFAGECFGYSNANCGKASDMSSHFICCSEPGHNENSIWAAAPNHSFECDGEWRDNCGSGTHLWNNEHHWLTKDTMADYCRDNHKYRPLFQ